MSHTFKKISSILISLVLLVSIAGASAYADTVYTVDATNYNAQAGTFTAVLYGIEDTSLVSSVQFPVWCAADQSDIVWYTAKLNGDGTYSATVNISKHANHTGTYTVHCYVNFKSGASILAGADTIEVSGSLGSVSVFSSDGIFYGMLQGCTMPGVSKVRFPVWSDAGGQDDVVWYTAQKQADGSYIAAIDLSKHKSLGDFTVHCYVVYSNGSQELVGGSGFHADTSAGTVSAVPGDAAGTYIVKLSGAAFSGGIKSVRFPVWNDANGQDDIIWYYGVKQSDGTYSATIKLSNHKNFGLFHAHCYVTDNSGTQSFAGGTTFTVDEPAGGFISVSSNGENSGSFHITFHASGSSSGISKVQFPVWCSADQSDIVWYTASRQSDGSFSCDVNFAAHKCHTGRYSIHAYVTDTNGKMALAAGTTYDLAVSGVNTITATPLENDGSRMLITLTNASIPGTVSSVYFPTWSSSNGQDDILWYKAKNIGGNNWQATINLSNHLNDGLFYTHAYANGSDLLGGITYDLVRASDANMNSRIAGKTSATNYLVAVDTTSNIVGIYQGRAGNWNLVQCWSCTTGAPSTPTITGEYTVGSKGASFSGSNYTCWYYTQIWGNYLFHSVLYERGSQSDIRVGTLGAHLSDGCVRLAIENARWLQNNVPTGSKIVIY